MIKYNEKVIQYKYLSALKLPPTLPYILQYKHILVKNPSRNTNITFHYITLHYITQSAGVSSITLIQALNFSVGCSVRFFVQGVSSFLLVIPVISQSPPSAERRDDRFTLQQPPATSTESNLQLPVSNDLTRRNITHAV